MSANFHLELTNVLTPDLFFRKGVPKEFLGFRIRVFQAPGGTHTSLVLDDRAFLVKVLGNVPNDAIHHVARAVFMGLEQGFKEGFNAKENSMFDDDEPQIALPFSHLSDSDVF